LTAWSHPFVERLIGTIRREFLDQTLFWNAVDLEKKLGMFPSTLSKTNPFTTEKLNP